MVSPWLSPAATACAPLKRGQVVTSKCAPSVQEALHCPATSWHPQAPSRTAVAPRSGSSANEASQGSAGDLRCPASISPPKQLAGSPTVYAEGAAIPLKRLARLLVEMPCLAAQLADEMLAVQAMHAQAASLDGAEAQPSKRARRMDSGVSSTVELPCTTTAGATAGTTSSGPAPASPTGPFKPTPLRSNTALLPTGSLGLPTPRKAATVPARPYDATWHRMAAVAGPRSTRSAFCPVQPQQPSVRAGTGECRPAQLSLASLALLEAFAASHVHRRNQASASQDL